MNISNKTGLVGFLLALSAFGLTSTAQAASDEANPIEARLSRLSSAVRERVNQLPSGTADPSLQRVAVGFTLAAIVGIAVGILIGSSALIYDAIDPIFQILRTVPPPSLATHLPSGFS